MQKANFSQHRGFASRFSLSISVFCHFPDLSGHFAGVDHCLGWINGLQNADLAQTDCAKTLHAIDLINCFSMDWGTLYGSKGETVHSPEHISVQVFFFPVGE
ncbi:MAG: hypothetical protein AAF399_04470 [Bacteroidota bacterium]